MNWLSIKKVLSDKELMELENELGITLPADYKDIIGEINGGALKNAVIQHPKVGTIAYSRNVSLNKEAKANIFELLPLFNDDIIRYFPFASVGNGDYYCFDLSNKQVVLYMHECDEYIHVCESFSQLLEMLSEYNQ